MGEKKEMTPREAIKLIKNRLIGNQREREAVSMVVDALERYWRPIRSEDDLPPLDEDGYSEKLLVSFANAIDPEIGEYRRKEDGSGGAFYVGDLDETFAQYGLIVNAWMPLRKSYRE